MRKLIILVLATMLALSFSAQADAKGKKKFRKEAIENTRLPDFTDIFNWGVKISKFKELYFFAGIAAQDNTFAIISAEDYVAQTVYILDEFDTFLAENKLDRDSIVRIEFTLVEGISPDDFGAVLGLFGGYFADVKVKPAAGTLRFVSGLAFPGLVVEYEIWAAK